MIQKNVTVADESESLPQERLLWSLGWIAALERQPSVTAVF